MYYLWLSECAVLDESEFEPNENYEAPTLSIWTDDNGGNHSSNVYKLKEEGNTYSGVEIGHSRDEVIEILVARSIKSYLRLNKIIIREILELCIIAILSK